MKTPVLLSASLQKTLFRMLGFIMIAALLAAAVFSAHPVGSALAAPGALCTSQADGNWSAIATWDCGHAPTNADDAVILHFVTINANQFVHSLAISGNSGSSLFGVLQFATDNTLTISGNFSVDLLGNFDPNFTGTMAFVGAAQTILTNGIPVDFWNLTDSTPGATLSVDPGVGGLHILNTLTLGGAPGNLLSLRSTVSGSRWQINPVGDRVVDYVNVQDSNNIDTTPISAPHGFNAGNNLGWVLTGSTVVLTSSLNPSGEGQLVTFTATVSPAAATGTVAFMVGTDAITDCSAQPVSSGVATCTTSSLSDGPLSITAVYSGDATYTSSTSNTLIQNVMALSTVFLHSSVNPSALGGPVTFTATISPVTVTGTVAFMNGVSAISGCDARPISLVGGIPTATCTTSALTLGPHDITAAYSGDTVFEDNSSPVFVQTVKNASATVVGSALNPSVVGKNVTFTVTVTAAAPGAAGGVSVQDNGVNIVGCIDLPLTGGTASCTVNTLSVGAHPITAVYGGDLNTLTSTSPAITHTVNNARYFLPKASK